jgi:hypothetical protein
MKKLATLGLVLPSLLGLASLLTFTTPAQASPQFDTRRVAAIATTYNGRAPYTEVFQFIQDTHLDLTDPTTRRQWCDRWQPSNVNPTVFQSRQATEIAIKNMMQSLKRMFD